MRKCYGQLGQDLLALDFFRSFPAEHKTFLDVGAFDGITFSNTRLFFEEGWSGVCIEPCLKNYSKLELLYKDTPVVTVKAAATDYEGELELNVATIPWAEEHGSPVSSHATDVIKRWPDFIWEKEIVSATTVNQILESNNITHIDFVSIDVEGQEMAVLRGFDLYKYQPHLIVVEYLGVVEKYELLEYLKLHDYFLWSDNGQDIFLVRGLKIVHLNILFKGWWHQHRRRLLDKLRRIKILFTLRNLNLNIK